MVGTAIEGTAWCLYVKSKSNLCDKQTSQGKSQLILEILPNTITLLMYFNNW